jgi:OmpA family protein
MGRVPMRPMGMPGRAAALVLGGALLLGCLAPRPVLYPNDALRAAEEAQVDQDIADCDALARKYEANPGNAGEIAGRTAEDAAVGSAAGAVGGAVAGNPGVGAAAGAAAGATSGLIHGIFHAHRNPSPIYRRFVERCLADKGYEVIGWE